MFLWLSISPVSIFFFFFFFQILPGIRAPCGDARIRSVTLRSVLLIIQRRGSLHEGADLRRRSPGIFTHGKRKQEGDSQMNRTADNLTPRSAWIMDPFQPTDTCRIISLDPAVRSDCITSRAEQGQMFFGTFGGVPRCFLPSFPSSVVLIPRAALLSPLPASAKASLPPCSRSLATDGSQCSSLRRGFQETPAPREQTDKYGHLTKVLSLSDSSSDAHPRSPLWFCPCS